MKEIYFDNAATTHITPIVLAETIDLAERFYANPSSKHRMGLQSEKEIDKVRWLVAAEFNCKPRQIIFTSGGTESNHLALTAANKKNASHEKPILVRSAIEHSSVIASMDTMRKRGFKVEVVPVDKTGKLDLSYLQELLASGRVVYVSIMHVNNELGIINPIENIGKMIRSSASAHATFHVDGIQAFHKKDLLKMVKYIDSYAISGHKIHAFKGVGALFVKEPSTIRPLFLGGGQEYGLRAGTENLLGIISMGLALKYSEPKHDRAQHVASLKKHLIHRLHMELEDIMILSEGKHYTPYITSVAMKGIKSEILLHSMENYGCYISSGSACNSRKQDVGHVIQALHLEPAYVDGVIRVSFCPQNTIREVDLFVDSLVECIRDIRSVLGNE